jgi:hypothetical protein
MRPDPRWQAMVDRANLDLRLQNPKPALNISQRLADSSLNCNCWIMQL